MSAQLSDIGAPARTEFRTTDSAMALAYYEDVYRTRMNFSGARDGHPYSHGRLPGGSFNIDDLLLPLHLSVVQEPFNSLVVVRVVAGGFERECAGFVERFGTDDVFIHADPSLPTKVRLLDAQFEAVTLDLAVLNQVAATSPTRAPGPVRFTRLQPVSRADAEHWRTTTRYLTGLLADSRVGCQSLLRTSAARMLAASALTTFPNTAVTEPTAQDRRDATNANVRRAIAFIEQDPHADISVADVAAAAHVSIRTVQLAFRRHLNTTPMRYLRNVRLDRVHCELLAADPGGAATVTEIANRWGFYNYSRFASQYRRAYGANPSDTFRSG